MIILDKYYALEKADNQYQLGIIDEQTKISIIKFLNSLPSTRSERKTGHWERHNTYHGDDTSGSVDPDWRCSECGGQANVNVWYMYDLTDFCPHCGADMRGEQE